MSVTKKGEIYDGVRGAKVEFGTFTLNPDTINAATEAETTIEFDGVASGDLVFVNPRSLTAGLLPKGARVTAADVVGVILRNELTTNVDGASITYDYVVIKFAGDA
jgi:hypothetical protein